MLSSCWRPALPDGCIWETQFVGLLRRPDRVGSLEDAVSLSDAAGQIPSVGSLWPGTQLSPGTEANSLHIVMATPPADPCEGRGPLAVTRLSPGPPPPSGDEAEAPPEGLLFPDQIRSAPRPSVVLPDKSLWFAPYPSLAVYTRLYTCIRRINVMCLAYPRLRKLGSGRKQDPPSDGRTTRIIQEAAGISVSDLRVVRLLRERRKSSVYRWELARFGQRRSHTDSQLPVLEISAVPSLGNGKTTESARLRG